MAIKIGDLSNNMTRSVDKVLPGSSAAALGLRAGDEIFEINGETIAPEQLAARLLQVGNVPVSLTIKRGGKMMPLGPTTLKFDPEAGFARLGVTFKGGAMKPADFSRVDSTVAWKIGRLLRGGSVSGVRG